MQLFHDLSQIGTGPSTVLTIGAFDGIHIGHQRLIRSVVQSARASGRRSALVTFFPPPGVVLGRCQPFYLTTQAEKLRQLERLGLDLAIIIEFTLAMARVSASDFIRKLHSTLNLSELWIGYDFALGCKREGDASNLRAMGKQAGFTVHQVPPVLWDGKPVSSTRIRAALTAGDLNQANVCLGRPFRLTGTAFPDRRDANSGVLNANLHVEVGHAIPRNGMYGCGVTLGRQTHHATAQVTRTPDQGAGTVKIHFQNYNSAFSGQTLSLDLLELLPTIPATRMREAFRALA